MTALAILAILAILAAVVLAIPAVLRWAETECRAHYDAAGVSFNQHADKAVEVANYAGLSCYDAAAAVLGPLVIAEAEAILDGAR